MQSDMWSRCNWFTGKPEQRILNWRNYRQNLGPDHLHQVARDWATCPLMGNYLTLDDPASWPDPWTLIGQGIYCDAARALGMFYTLHYSDYRHRDTLMLQCFKDIKNHQYLNLVNCESGKYMLNYDLGAIVNIDTIHIGLELVNNLTIKNLPV
jgi:hypothetical protein